MKSLIDFASNRLSNGYQNHRNIVRNSKYLESHISKKLSRMAREGEGYLDLSSCHFDRKIGTHNPTNFEEFLSHDSSVNLMKISRIKFQKCRYFSQIFSRTVPMTPENFLQGYPYFRRMSENDTIIP